MILLFMLILATVLRYVYDPTIDTVRRNGRKYIIIWYTQYYRRGHKRKYILIPYK